MTYEKIFNPVPLLQDFRDRSGSESRASADRRDGKVYLYDEDIVLRVNVALATGRPLLVRGSSGCGKSSLAHNIARVMKRRYYERVMTARDQARDLLWRFDAVRRLGEAQVVGHSQVGVDSDLIRGSGWLRSAHRYIEPEVLWWVIDRESAGQRGLPAGEERLFERAVDPVVYSPTNENGECDPNTPCVVLIDEIDKVEPDVPNDLLVPLGSLEFRVHEIARSIHFDGRPDVASDFQRLPLVIITSNDERRLPPAFLRRCIQLEIPPAKRSRLIEIAKACEGEEDAALYEQVLSAITDCTSDRNKISDDAPCSIAEFLDAVRACRRLKWNMDPNTLRAIAEATAWKRATVGGRS